MYLLSVVVPPIYSELNGFTFVVIPYRPVVVHWLKTSCEEIIVVWFYQQRY